MELESAENLIVSQQRERAVGTDGCVRQAGGAITADSAPAQSMDARFDLLVEEGYACVYANSAAGSGVVERTRGRICRAIIGPGNPARGGCDVGRRIVGVCSGKSSREVIPTVCVVAREYSIPEGRNQSENFVVSPARIQRRLENEVRRLVECVGSGRIVKSTAQSRSTDEEIVVHRGCDGWRGDAALIRIDGAEIGDGRVSVNSCGDCGIFHRSRHREFIPETLGYAELVLPRPAEAHRVLWVDGQGQSFRAVLHSLSRFSDQAPHLPAREAPAIVELGLAPSLAETQYVAVAFVVI